MEYGQIIKKAWKIAWRFRFLWVLGFFAGITGMGGGGGGYSGGSSTGRSFGSSGSGSSGSGGPFTGTDVSKFTSQAERWIPVLVAVVLVWILLALLFWVLSLAAKAGLIWAVDEIEEGRTPTLGDAWRRGFSHMWQVFGLGLLLQLPVLILVLVFAAFVAVPVVLAISKGGDAAAVAAIVPICGSLIIGIPLLLVLGFILGIMHVIALRRIVLDGEGVIQSAKDSWRTFRARFKDTALMWLINWGLNVAAGLVIGIPILVISLVLVVPAVFAGVGQQWGALAGMIGLWTIVLIVVSIFYTGVWGTFTSALWTILYRRMTGREVVIPTPRPGRPPAGWPAQPPVAPAGPMPQDMWPTQPVASGSPTDPAFYPPAPPMGPMTPPAETPPAPPVAAPPAETFAPSEPALSVPGPSEVPVDTPAPTDMTVDAPAPLDAGSAEPSSAFDTAGLGGGGFDAGSSDSGTSDSGGSDSSSSD